MKRDAMDAILMIVMIVLIGVYDGFIYLYFGFNFIIIYKWSLDGSHSMTVAK